MSSDIDLTSEDDKVYVCLICSAGVFRVFGGEPLVKGQKKRFFEMSEPIKKEKLIRLKTLLDSVDLDEYEY